MSQINEFPRKNSGSVSDVKPGALANGTDLEHIAYKAGERVSDLATNFARASADSAKSMSHYVRENPIKGAAVAGAAGILVGTLLTMILRSPKA